MLAEFLGANPHELQNGISYYFSKNINPSGREEGDAEYMDIALPFLKSWNWLIPVYQKFYKIISDRGGHTWFVAMELKQRFSGYVTHGTTEEAFDFLASEIRKFNNQEGPY